MTNEENRHVFKTYSQEMTEAHQEGQKSVKRKQKERKIRKQRKKLKMVKGILRFLVFALLVLCMYEIVMLPQWYLKKDAFSKPDKRLVTLVNNRLIPSSVLYDSIKKIKIKKVPIFLMSVRPIKREIYKIPVVKNVFVRRYGFPARVQIIVRERVPVTVIKSDIKQKPIAFVTTDGVMVVNPKYMEHAQSADTLVILAKNPNLEKDWNVKRAQYIEKIAKSVETYSQEKVEYVDMNDPNDVYVKIESTKIRLGVLDSTVFERIKRIYTILPQIDGVDGTIKYIDLSWDKVNYLKMQDKKSEKTEKNPEKENKKDEIQR